MRRSKRGFTLVELCVVMALVGIVGALIVTFSLLMNHRVQANKKQGAIIDDVTGIELMLKNWIRRYDNSDYYFTVSPDKTQLLVYDTKGTLATKTDDVLKNSLFLRSTEGLYEGTPEDPKNIITCENILSLVFGITDRNSSKGHHILYCDVTYLDATGENSESIRFMFTTFAQNFKE